jgi:molybdenum cofactor cytidylyltransferase
MPPTEATPVAGLVLAAGASVRLGCNKLLLDLGGETLVRRATRAAIDAGLDPVIIVLGHEAARVREELGDLACAVVLNPDHARGAGTSLRAGVAHALETDAGAVVLALADMPLVTAEMIATLAARWRETRAPLVVSRYGETQAPPTLFDRSLFAELLASDDSGGAKPVTRGHTAEAVVVEWPAAAMRDLDVAADYDELRAQLTLR